MAGKIVRSILFFGCVTACGAGAGLLARIAIVQESTSLVRAEGGERAVRDGDDEGAVDDINSAAHLGVNHDRVKRSFRGVVAEGNRSTVRVLVQGKQVALGAVVAADGWIITKAGELGTPLTCVIPGGKSYDGEVLAEDRDTDLALVKIDCDGLIPAKFADLELPRGSWLAVPGGRGDYPLVVGVVSTAPRDVEAEGAALGIQPVDSANGPRVKFVVENSAAERMGLKTGDVVHQINGTELHSSEELIRFIARFHEGDEIHLAVTRDGETIPLRARLGSAMEVRQSIDGLDGFESGPTSHRRSGFPDVIQHDCVLLPQQCGGPAVDLEGRIVGINIARAGRIATYALPSTVVTARIASLMNQAREARSSAHSRSAEPVVGGGQ